MQRQHSIMSFGDIPTFLSSCFLIIMSALDRGFPILVLPTYSETSME